MYRIGILFIAAGTIFLNSCSGCQSFNNDTSSRTISVAEATTKKITQAVPVSTKLIAGNIVTITAPADSKMSDLMVTLGQDVKRGDNIARFGDSAITLRLNELGAQRKEAEALVKRDELRMKTRDTALEEGKIDQDQYDTIEADQNAHKATLERIKTEIASIELSYPQALITSPADGTITEIGKAKAGDNVKAGDLIAVVSALDPIFVTFTLPSKEAMNHRLNDRISVNVLDLGRKKFTATITNVMPSYISGNFEFTASIPNSTKEIKHEMTGEILFKGTDMQTVSVVPLSSVIRRSSGDYVFIVSGGTARETKVKVVNAQNYEADLTEGVHEGDVVVVEGASSLSDGDPVEIYNH